MSLLLAVQKNDYEAVLRLLYLNPFIGFQEKSDAIWCCTSFGNVSLLRTLLESGGPSSGNGNGRSANVDVCKILKPSRPGVCTRRFCSTRSGSSSSSSTSTNNRLSGGLNVNGVIDEEDDDNIFGENMFGENMFGEGSDKNKISDNKISEDDMITEGDDLHFSEGLIESLLESSNTPIDLAIELGKRRPSGPFWDVAKLLKKFDSSSALFNDGKDGGGVLSGGGGVVSNTGGFGDAVDDGGGGCGGGTSSSNGLSESKLRLLEEVDVPFAEPGGSGDGKSVRKTEERSGSGSAGERTFGRNKDVILEDTPAPQRERISLVNDRNSPYSPDFSIPLARRSFGSPSSPSEIIARARASASATTSVSSSSNSNFSSSAGSFQTMRSQSTFVPGRGGRITSVSTGPPRVSIPQFGAALSALPRMVDMNIDYISPRRNGDRNADRNLERNGDKLDKENVIPSASTGVANAGNQETINNLVKSQSLNSDNTNNNYNNYNTGYEKNVVKNDSCKNDSSGNTKAARIAALRARMSAPSAIPIQSVVENRISHAFLHRRPLEEVLPVRHHYNIHTSNEGSKKSESRQRGQDVNDDFPPSKQKQEQKPNLISLVRERAEKSRSRSPFFRSVGPAPSVSGNQEPVDVPTSTPRQQSNRQSNRQPTPLENSPISWWEQDIDATTESGCAGGTASTLASTPGHGNSNANPNRPASRASTHIPFQIPSIPAIPNFHNRISSHQQRAVSPIMSRLSPRNPFGNANPVISSAVPVVPPIAPPMAPRNHSQNQRHQNAIRQHQQPQKFPIDQGENCVVCADGVREVVFIPCGHYCCCSECSERIGDFCPVCRETIRLRNRVFR